jgi:16S rRNA processing protein RimM
VPLRPDELTVMGHVGVPFGVRGWVKVHAYTEHSDSLLDYPVWWLGRSGQWREYEVLGCEEHPKALIAHLAGSNDREAAIALRGCEIAVPKSSLPPAAANEYYWADLIGLEVVNAEQQSLGRVTGLLETGANDVLVVQGERERLIPFVAQVVLEVDLATGTVRVVWGLDW